MIPEALKENPDPDRLIEELLEAGWTMPLLEVILSRLRNHPWRNAASLLHLPPLSWQVAVAFVEGMHSRRRKKDEVGNYLLELSAKIAAAHQTAPA